MGLFRKKNDDAEHLRMMQEQLVTMRERLDASDAAKSHLEERVGHLDAENQRLSSQVGDVEVQVVTVQGKVGAVEGRVGEVASVVGTVASKVGTVESHVGDVVMKVGSVEAQVAGVAKHVGTVESKMGAVESKMGTVESKVGTVETQLGDVGTLRSDVDRMATAASQPVASSVDSQRVDEVEQRLAEQVAALSATVEEQRIHLADLALVAKATAEQAAAAASADVDHTPPRLVDEEIRLQVGQIAEKMTTLDGRVTQISVELANQLTELASELDAANQRGGDVSGLEQRLEDITSGQTRLANEQARYEIQFRGDLAELVERLRRPSAH